VEKYLRWRESWREEKSWRTKEKLKDTQLDTARPVAIASYDSTIARVEEGKAV